MINVKSETCLNNITRICVFFAAVFQSNQEVELLAHFPFISFVEIDMHCHILRISSQ